MRTVYGIQLLALACSVWLIAGCASAPKSKGWSAWSFSKKPKEDEKGPKIVTPREKMEQLRELGANSSKMSPQLRETVAGELTHGIVHEKDPVLRAQILRTLAHFPSEKSASILAAGLHDHDRDVRIAACESLGKYGGTNSVQELSQVIKDDADVDVRLAAVRGLGDGASPGAVAVLGEALDDQDPAMQHRAIASMKKLSNQDFGTDVEAWRQYAKSGQGPPKPTLAERIRKWF
jgi:hypothetical protein